MIGATDARLEPFDPRCSLSLFYFNKTNFEPSTRLELVIHFPFRLGSKDHQNRTTNSNSCTRTVLLVASVGDPRRRLSAIHG